MKYSIGTNFDPELLDFIIEKDTHRQIESVFGKLKKDVIGGGRASNVLPDLTTRQLRAYIDKCKENKIGFNYLLNPMCLGNREITPSEHKKIIQYIGELQNIGIDHVTINSPYLCELIKKRFPSIKVTIGLYAYVYSLQHVKYWIDLGADELTLHHRINRNFDYLKTMLTYYKNTNIKFRVIANNICLHDCPYQINHGCGQSHASQESDESKCIYLDYNLLKCNLKKITSAKALLASDWIRPEDVVHYQNLCEETRNTNFSIKLLERTKTTEFLKRVVNAYIDECYNGNLIDLMTWPTTKSTKDIDKKDIILKTATKGYNMKALMDYKKAFELPDVYIDNSKLNGFIERFLKGTQCDCLVCGTSAEYGGNTPTCNYCEVWASQVVSYNDEEVEKWSILANKVLDSMVESSIFGCSKVVER